MGLNAATSHDCTRYFASLPANKLELWFALESQRWRAPVLRQLYSEKRVVAEERRMRVDNSPSGRWAGGWGRGVRAGVRARAAGGEGLARPALSCSSRRR